MSDVRTTVGVALSAGVRVRRAQAMRDVLAFALDVLRLPGSRRVVERGVAQNPWLTRLAVVGLDGDGEIREELAFELDWERHRLHLSQGRDAVEVSEGRSLVATVSPELLTALRLFKEACVLGEHDVRCLFRHVEVPGVDVASELGLGESVTLRYAGDRLSAGVSTGELDEMDAAYNRYGKT